MALSGDRTLGDTTGADDLLTFLCLGCEGIKAQGFLCSGSVLADTILSCCFLLNYCTVVKLF